MCNLKYKLQYHSNFLIDPDLNLQELEIHKVNDHNSFLCTLDDNLIELLQFPVHIEIVVNFWQKTKILANKPKFWQTNQNAVLQPNQKTKTNPTFNMYFVCSLSLKLTFWLLGACEGDSGSPVIRRISVSGRGRPFYQQDFIVSTGLDCRLRATIYTRVSQRKVLHWIQKISGTQPVVMVVGGFSSHTKDFLKAKAKVITSYKEPLYINYSQYSISQSRKF